MAIARPWSIPLGAPRHVDEPAGADRKHRHVAAARVLVRRDGSGDLESSLEPRRQNYGGSRFPTGTFCNTNRLLVLDGAQPGEDSSVRGTLGPFSFPRRGESRPHCRVHGFRRRRLASASADLFGHDLSDCSFRSTSTATIASFERVDHARSVDYSSTFRSFEANYRVRQRLTARPDDHGLQRPLAPRHRSGLESRVSGRSYDT